MLKSLELSGFKSFADPTRLEFAEGISALVGPNGSGKSNIVDAIKWVLGEQSVKKLRAGESTDVIFNGSTTRAAMNAAEVTLTFTNLDRRLQVDADEVHFTRRVYRSGESEYLINRQASRLKDFREILCGTGLGLHAYSIIEQGRVEGLLQSTSQQRRIVLEEAAGTALYRIKMQETERKLERVQQNMVRISDVVGEIDNQLRNTKSQAGKAQLYRQYTARLKELRIEVALVEWYRNRATLAGLENECRDAARQADDREADVKQDETGLFELNQAVDRHDQNLRRLGKELATLRESIVRAESTRDFQSEQIEAHQKELSESGLKLIELKEHNDGAEGVVRQTDDEIAATKKEVDEIKRVFETSEADLNEQVRRSDELRGQNEEAHHTIQQWRVDESRIAGEINGFVARRNALRKTRSKLAKKSARLRDSIDRLANEDGRLKALYDEGKSRQDDVAQRLESIDAEKSELAASRETIRAELAQLNLRQSAMNERFSLLKELLRRNEGHNPGVQEVLANMSNPDSPFRFAYGLIANLFRVDRAAAELIGFTLGQKVEYVVVPPEPELFKYVESHSEHFAGRVGFIWLDAKHNDDTWRNPCNYESRPGVLGRADQFVETDPLFEPLLRRLLGRTWIVESFTVAKRLYREGTGQDFLTIKGEYLAFDGSVVVGPPDRYTGLLSRRSELRELQESIPATDAEIAQRRTALDSVEAAVADAQKRYDAANEECRQVQGELDSVRLRRQTTRTNDTNLRDEFATCIADLRTCEENLAQLTTDQAAREKDGIDLADRRAALAVQLARSEKEYASRERDRTAALDKTNGLRIELEKSNARLKFLNERKNQYEESRKERDRLIADHYEHSAQLKRRRDEAELAVLRIESALASHFGGKERINRELGAVSREKQKVVAARGKVQARLKKSRSEAERLRMAAHTAELEIERVDSEQKKIADRIAEDYGIELGDEYIAASGFFAQPSPDSETRQILEDETERSDDDPQNDDSTQNDDTAGDTANNDNDNDDAAAGDTAAVVEDVPEPTPEEIEEILREKTAALDDNRREIEVLKDKLQKLGNVNLEAIETLESLESKYHSLYDQYKDLVTGRNAILKLMEMMKNDSQRLFQETFDSVKIYFCEIFQQLFGGGHADLILEDEANPLESGIEIVVRPPGKDLKSVMLMSGGEKTLTCIALLLAIFRHRATPVCILDEVDAALDEGNVGRFVKVVRNLQIDTQFLIITHSRKTMTCGKTMYGVTMQEPGVSTLVGVEFEDVGENGEIVLRKDPGTGNQGAA